MHQSWVHSMIDALHPVAATSFHGSRCYSMLVFQPVVDCSQWLGQNNGDLMRLCAGLYCQQSCKALAFTKEGSGKPVKWHITL